MHYIRLLGKLKANMFSRILKSTYRSKRTRQREKKDNWDKTQIVFTAVTPLAIFLAGLMISESSKKAEIQIAQINSKVRQAELIKTFIDDLTAIDQTKKTLALDAIFYAFPHDIAFNLTRSIVINDSSVAIREYAEKRIGIPTPYENDVLDEWVLVITKSEDENRAERLLSEFKTSYEKSGEKLWINDIFLVRDPRESGYWLIVIDTFSGPSSQAVVLKELNRLQSKFKESRELRNTIGRWFEKAEVMFYSSEDFVGSYGTNKE